MIYEIKKDPNKGCIVAILLFIICLVFGMLTSCTKDETIIPIKKPSKDKICLGCKPTPRVDTTFNK